MLHFITPQRPRGIWIPRASEWSTAVVDSDGALEPHGRMGGLMCGRKIETPLLILKRTKSNTAADCLVTHTNWYPSTSCMSVVHWLSNACSYYSVPSRVLLSDFHTVASAFAHCDIGSFHPGIGGMAPVPQIQYAGCMISCVNWLHASLL